MSRPLGKNIGYSIVFGVLMFIGYCGSIRAQNSPRQNDMNMSDAKTGFGFTKHIQPILDAECVACHLTGASQGELNLEEGSAYSALVMQPSRQSKLMKIAPGKPEESYLLYKLEGSHIQVGGLGTQMPPLSPLSRESIDVIRKWISDGALNN